MQQQKIVLELTLEEANLILEGLGSLPYGKVYATVMNIQRQAQKQLENPDSDSEVEANSVAEKQIPVKK